MDSKTGFFYGSAIVKLSSKDHCRALLEDYKTNPPRIRNKFIGWYFDENRKKKKKYTKDDDVRGKRGAGRYKRLFKKGERPPVVCM